MATQTELNEESMIQRHNRGAGDAEAERRKQATQPPEQTQPSPRTGRESPRMQKALDNVDAVRQRQMKEIEQAKEEKKREEQRRQDIDREKLRLAKTPSERAIIHDRMLNRAAGKEPNPNAPHKMITPGTIGRAIATWGVSAAKKAAGAGADVVANEKTQEGTKVFRQETQQLSRALPHNQPQHVIFVHLPVRQQTRNLPAHPTITRREPPAMVNFQSYYSMLKLGYGGNQQPQQQAPANGKKKKNLSNVTDPLDRLNRILF